MLVCYLEICRGIFDVGLSKHEERAVEVNEFWECINEAKTGNKNEGMEYINNFLGYKKQVTTLDILFSCLIVFDKQHLITRANARVYFLGGMHNYCDFRRFNQNIKSCLKMD